MRKRFFLCVAMIFVAAGLFALNIDVHSNYFHIDGNGYITLKSYDDYPSDMVIPQTVDGKIVRGIGDYAFYDCKNLYSIRIHEGVKHIGDCAFCGATGLKAVYIPADTAFVGYQVFGDWGSNQKIHINAKGPGVKWDKNWNRNCSAQVIWQSSAYCTVSFYLTNGVFVSSERVYKGDTCPFPPVQRDGYTFVGWYASNGVQYNQNSVFNSDVILTARWKENYDGLFVVDASGTLYLVSKLQCPSVVVIPPSVGGRPVLHIGDRAFENCAMLQEVLLPNTIKTIGENAFKGCANLVSINIPFSVNRIGRGAFYGCYQLFNFNVGSY